MHLIWHGTASVEIISDLNTSLRLLFDPFVPLAGSKVPVKIEDFDGFTDIFITHGHFDHISNLPEIVRRNPKVRIYCTRTPRATLLRKGVSRQNIHLLDFGDTVKVSHPAAQGIPATEVIPTTQPIPAAAPASLTVSVLHGKHAVLPRISISRLGYILKSPARSNLPHILREHLSCVENDETVFYVIEGDGQKICLMGSLNLRGEVEYPIGADLLVLPYNGWEDNYPPAVRTIERLKPARVVLDHYDDTFPPITMPLNLQPLLDRYKGRVKPMIPGEVSGIINE